jgi:signal transduction histidine kinase/ActR/RegA family two-component response regulator
MSTRYILGGFFWDLGGFTFPVEWTRATLVLALTSIGMVIALFAFLNRNTRRRYFSLWLVAWVLYAVYLAAAIGLDELPNVKFFVMARDACVGISALYMFWGGFHLIGRARSDRELHAGTVMIAIWSCVSAYFVDDPFWSAMPMFSLLAGAGLFAGIAYLLRRKQHQGAWILGTGFSLWGLHLLAFPFLEQSPALMAVAYFTSTVLVLMIAMGMILEQEVAVAEQSYRQLLDSAKEAIFLIDVWTLKILDANLAAHRLTRHEPGTLFRRPFPDVCPDLRNSSVFGVDNTKLFLSFFRPFHEFSLVRADGDTILCEGDTTLVERFGRVMLQVNVRELAERKRVGEQLRRSEKLSALGQLIAGVAHELNNPLAVVQGYSQLLARRDDVSGKVRQDILKVLHESERAAKIVRDLLAYARPSEPQKVAVDINQLVGSVLDNYEADVKAAQVRLHRQFANHILKTRADRAQIEQVVINLLTNALHAVSQRPHPRRISVTTEETTAGIRFSVADNGPGVRRDIVGKIFDPFFTTKPLGKGTGLGLTISNSIVQEHKGRMLVESEPGQGATFIVELPIVECKLPAVAPQTELPTQHVVEKANSARILVVDDEPGILEVLKATLESCGYEVDTAANGVQAIERIETGAYDLIMSDMRMPDMGGEQLYKRLLESHSELAHRIIYVTGDTVSPDTRSFLESTGNRWLSKPFNIRDILQIVEESLATDREPVAAGA